MRDRIEGATLPGLAVTVVTDGGAEITDGESYTWTCEASARAGARTRIWQKSSDITPAAAGFTVIWADDDIGALPAGSYLLEFTGVNGTQTLKHHEAVKILAEVTAT